MEDTDTGKTELPGIQDLVGIISSKILGDDLIGVKIDIKAAFKRIKIAPNEYKKNVVVIDGKYYYYNALPFGSKVSAYYWQRIAALIHRILQAIIANYPHAGMVYVDDSLWIFKKKDAPLLTTILFMMLQVMKVPLPWNKTIFGSILDWVGHEVELKDFTIPLPKSKKEKILRKVRKLLTERYIALKKNKVPQAPSHGPLLRSLVQVSS